MAAARLHAAGELVAALVRLIPPAVWCPDRLPSELNPFKEEGPVSEAMREHLRKWERARFRAAAGGA